MLDQAAAEKPAAVQAGRLFQPFVADTYSALRAASPAFFIQRYHPWFIPLQKEVEARNMEYCISGSHRPRRPAALPTHPHQTACAAAAANRNAWSTSSTLPAGLDGYDPGL